MADWNDFAYEEDESRRGPDEYEVAAKEKLRKFFEEKEPAVYFANQLAVQHEGVYFHWITHRAITELVGEGVLKTETRKLATGSDIKLVWPKRHRYYRRDARRVVNLVNEYGSPNMCASIGLHGEQMILAAFARRQFVMTGHNTRKYGNLEWEETQHNLDFIFDRDGAAYGLEVKNTLSYMDEKEFDVKIRLCEHLGIRPVFAVRMLPKTWMKKLIDRGGYGMILKYQLYPWTHVELARRVARELGLPVDAPRALADGTMDRFLKWHAKNV